MKTHYVVLLRGINVGGKNLIKMSDLKACLEADGHTDVATYIQSGNVLLTSADNKTKLAERLQKILKRTFGYDATTVIKSLGEMRHIVTTAPKGFGNKPNAYRYDVLFLKGGISANETFKQVSLKAGVDAATAGEGVLYFSRTIAHITSSHISKIIYAPFYKDMTIRNWNTTSKLLALMEAREEQA